MSQTCKNHVGPTCKALGLPAAVPWLWQVTSELRAAAVGEVKLWHEDAAITATWIEGTTCKKNAILHCGSAPFFSHTCWKLDALLWNQNMQSIIAICWVRAGHACIMTGPAIRSTRNIQDTLDISDTPETSDTPDTPDMEIAKSPDTPDCWLLLVVLACGKLVSKDSNADSDSLDLNIGSNHTVLHSLWDLLFPQLKKVEVRPGLSWVILERATCPLHGKDLGAIGVVHGNCRCHRPVPGLQE